MKSRLNGLGRMSMTLEHLYQACHGGNPLLGWVDLLSDLDQQCCISPRRDSDQCHSKVRTSPTYSKFCTL